jgi:hypothetical protein
VLDDTKRGWKADAKDRCRAIIEALADGQMIAADEDVEFLRRLLDRHPCAAEKIGQGVAGFSVQTVKLGTRCLVVHRVDGTSTDFSYYKCISEPSATGLARAAMRRAIADQVAHFKWAACNRGPLVCAVTGDRLSWDGAHVDHAPPVFVALADTSASRAGGYSAIQLLPTEDGQIGRILAPADADSWTSFHRANAKPRIVSKHTNLSLLRRATSQVPPARPQQTDG